MSPPVSYGWNRDQYALLDFGGGRKLERFGAVVLDRPCPAAWVCSRSLPSQGSGASLTATNEMGWSWDRADVRLDDDGKLLAGQIPAADWSCHYGQNVFKLKLTPFGHVGLFPEQAANWQWLNGLVERRRAANQGELRALNLFAYTGGTTMCLAATGVQVVHVDASAPAVNWARANMQASGSAHLPVRWIVDDARKFVARELRRGNRYDLIVLDPPSYGHGAGGERFTIEDHLRELVDNCWQLLNSQRGALLLSAHCERPSGASIAEWVEPKLGAGVLEQARLQLYAASGKILDAGFYVRAEFLNV